MRLVAGKRFSWNDQQSFADSSGDVNPIHMDPVAARRTSAGAPVVHGIHVLVWAIDELVKHLGVRHIAGIKADWSHFLYVGEAAELIVESENDSRLRARVCVESAPVATMTLFFGATAPGASCQATDDPVVPSPEVPANLGLDALAGQFGAVGCPASAEQIAYLFPFAASNLGSIPIAGLLALSRLVGMICPGLHSIFARLDVAVVGVSANDFIAYKVTDVDERFRYVTQAIHGAGLEGTVETFARNAPIEQPGIEELSKSVDPTEFRGSSALVIGGSRGLGETTAKFLAAGGAHVIVSYSIGRADADRVASSIRAAGRTCEVIHYDVHNAAVNQLDCLVSTPTQVYFFATGPISQSRTKPFDSGRFDEFCAFYVEGFARLCSCLRPSPQSPVRVFYPSTVYISADNRPQGFGEYAMAKAAGETLCAEINRACPHIEVLARRLPRMRTDQTASFVPEGVEAPREAVLLAVIREMHGK